MAEGKRVVVTGATGLIGRALCKELRGRGYQVVVFSRSPEKARSQVPGAAEYVAWEPQEDGPWAAAIDGAHAVVSLAGANIGRRWSESYKKEIMDSRVVGTRGLVKAMGRAASKPRVFVSTSAVGYYGSRGDATLDEAAAPGQGFLAEVCKAWEAEAAKAEQHGVRTAIVRNGIVLDRREGGLGKLLLPFKLFAGGPIGDGKQWWPWVHLEDVVGIYMLALEDERVRGPINATAPEPQTNRDFAKTLGKVLSRPAVLPTPGFALKLVMGEMVDDLLLSSQRVLPKKAEEVGYRFKHPTSEEALRATINA